MLREFSLEVYQNAYIYIPATPLVPLSPLHYTTLHYPAQSVPTPFCRPSLSVIFLLDPQGNNLHIRSFKTLTRVSSECAPLSTAYFEVLERTFLSTPTTVVTLRHLIRKLKSHRARLRNRVGSLEESTSCDS